MSEERFDRLESQLDRVIQGMAAMQTRIDSIEGTLQTRIDSIEGTLQTRIDSIEGTLMVAMRSGFDSLQTAINDLNVDLNVLEV
jgi:hypothetical protein